MGDVSRLPWLLAEDGDARALVREAGRQLASEAASESAATLWRLGAYDLSLASAQQLQKAFLASGGAPGGFRKVAVRLVGAGTLDFLAAALSGASLKHGLVIVATSHRIGEVVEATWRKDAPFEKADFVVLWPDTAGLLAVDGTPFSADAHPLVDSIVEQTIALARSLREHTGATPVVCLAPPPFGELRNSHDLALPASARAAREAVNRALAAGAKRHGYLLWDVNALSASIGTHAWHDAKQYHLAKLPFAVPLTMRVADDLARTIAASSGRSRRALVLDLDNTLWGGIIGDDGLAGIEIGQGNATGEAFLAVQRAVLELRRRGVVVAVCSQNSEAIARTPFSRHPDMLLREEHIAVFMANWQDKAANIAAIAERLNLGPSSLAFLDDNPAERARIRQALPEVAVIEIDEDPASIADRLLCCGYFEHLILTDEDLSRADDYQANVARSQSLAQSQSYEDYLQSLRMTLQLSRFDEVGLPRIAQLVSKSNQFNLTSRRYNETELRNVAGAQDRIGIQVRLKDRFGDNGMISVVILRADEGRLWIDLWLMSCRVLRRGVEQGVLNAIAAIARSLGIPEVVGEYKPTNRNALVADHYEKLGFEPINTERVKRPADAGADDRYYLLDVRRYEEKPFLGRVEDRVAQAPETI